MVSVRWGHGRARGYRGRQERSSGPNNPVQPDTRLAGGTMGGDMQGGGVQFPEHLPGPPPTLPHLSQKKRHRSPPHPCLLVLEFPLPQYPPVLPTPPPLIKFVKCNHLFWGFLESRLDMFRSTEDLVSSGRVTVNCGRSTKANGGALGSQDQIDGMLHLQSPKS